MKKIGWIILCLVLAIWSLLLGSSMVYGLHNDTKILNTNTTILLLILPYILLAFIISIHMLKEFFLISLMYKPNKSFILKQILVMLVFVGIGGLVTDNYLKTQEDKIQKDKYLEEKKKLNRTPQELEQEAALKESNNKIEKEKIRQETIQLRELLVLKKNIKYRYPRPDNFLLVEAFINKDSNNLTNRIICLRYRYGIESPQEFNQIFVNGKISTALSWNQQCNEEVGISAAHIIDIYDWDIKR